MESIHTFRNLPNDLGKVEILPFKNLLHSRILQLPPNQRPYSWGKKELSDLWEDLMLLNGNSYLMGSIILQTPSLVQSCDNSSNDSPTFTSAFVSNNGGTYTPFILVDGQQRLVSLTILLRVLCDYVQSADMLEFIEYDFLFCKGITQGEINKDLDSEKDSEYSATRLQLPYHFSQTFREILKIDQAKKRLCTNDTSRGNKWNAFSNANYEVSLETLSEITAPEQRMLDAFQFFSSMISQKRSSLAAVDESQFLLFIRDLLVTITTKLVFDVRTSNSESPTGILFRAHNCRGKSLTLADSLKNLLIHYSSVFNDIDLANKIDKLWYSIYKYLSIVELPQHCDDNYFIKTFWRSYSSSNATGTDSELYYEIQNFISNRADIKTEITRFTDELSQSIEPFCSIMTITPIHAHIFTKYESPNQRNLCFLVCDNLRKLHCIELFCGLLSQTLRFATINEFISVAIACERHSMLIYRLSGKKISTSRSWFTKLSASLRLGQGRVVGTLAHTILDHTTQTVDVERISEFISSSNTNFTEWKYTKYLLCTCERQLIMDPFECESEKEWLLYRIQLLGMTLPSEEENITIEHVLPQNFYEDSTWIDAFGSAQICKSFLDRLGNLTLSLRQSNSSYGASSFFNKKNPRNHRNYCTSSLFIERQISHYPKWEPDAVIEREELLKEMISMIWNVRLTLKN